RITRWYRLTSVVATNDLDEASACVRALLSDSVALRLRADVPVGSCLSGGLDSSAIVCLAHRALGESKGGAGQITVTACYEEQRFDEWRFAEQVVRQTGAHPVRVWPSVERLQAEL